METVSVAEAKSHFSELIARASAGERFLIHRREHTVAILLGPKDLEQLERASHAAHDLGLALGQSEQILDRVENGTLHPAMAAFGLWRDEDDLADLAERIATARRQAGSRPGVDL